MIELKTRKILADVEGGIGWLTFNHPERRNAVSLEMWQGIGDAGPPPCLPATPGGADGQRALKG